MYSGFPLDQIDLLRCPVDARRLEVASSVDGVGFPWIVRGSLRCTGCGRAFAVGEGIVDLLDEGALHPESLHELRMRDEEAVAYETAFVGDRVANATEMGPMLAALRPCRADVLFELGCGTGRYTLPIAQTCRALVAVDFSTASLRLLAARLPAGAPVGLVHADVTRLCLAPRRFDGGLSTLVSNLPRADHRGSMYRLAASSLRPRGRFVFGAHHYGWPARARGIAREGYYADGGIYRRYFTRREVVEEVEAFFRRCTAQPVQVPVPLGRRLGLPVVALSRVLGRVPIINQLGQLLMVVATDPHVASKGPGEPRGVMQHESDSSARARSGAKVGNADWDAPRDIGTRSLR